MAAPHLLKTNGIVKKSLIQSYRGKPIIETLNNGYFIVDHRWTVTYWNKAAGKLTGVPGKDVIGKNFWEKFASLLPVEFYAVYHRAFLKDIPTHFREYWAEMGAWFDVTTWYSDDTLCVSFKSSNQPYPEYPDKPQQRLETLTELYKFVTEITNDCLWEWDLAAHEIFWIDGGHKRVFGYPIENSLVPESFWKNCIHPEDRERVLAKLNNIIREGNDTLWEDEYRFRKSDGDYLYVRDRGHIVYDEENKGTRIIGATQDINEPVLLQNELTEKTLARQREVTRAVLTAQERERVNIGKELHDNLGQTLAVAKMYLQMAQKSDTTNHEYVGKSLDFVMSVMDEIRRISKVLVIPSKNIIGLFENILVLIKDITTVHPIKMEFYHSDISEGDINDELQLAIFRIIQEQVNNILTHSEASLASIILRKSEGKIVLIVSDNGKGFDPLTSMKKGVGIINIRSRVDICHGHVKIESQPGKGYELRAVFPG
ncbi:MAG TPA: PAS domain-containing protein [Chitinophagaceae bacterium]|nr:PAS domain-containing protein [Chitinophagaceae bacterium]